MDITGLIVGLGNPGPKYTATRHNIGFMLVDSVLADAEGKDYRRLRQLRRLDDLELWSVSLPRCKGEFLLLKPLTYMNLSGKAALRVCKEYGVSPKAMLVVHDELDLPLGRLKFKQAGGTAGHNGLKSLVAELGTEAFTRLRLGIGRPPREIGVSDWVLAPFGEAEQPVVAEVVKRARESLPLLFGQGLNAAMQAVHAFDAMPKPEPQENGAPPTGDAPA